MLFDLVLRLQKLQMSGDLIFYEIHLSGVIIQKYRKDSLSRSDPLRDLWLEIIYYPTFNYTSELWREVNIY